MIRWPGVVPPNTISQAITSSLDWFPTVAALAGDDSKMLRCGDSTMLRCGDSTMLRCGDSTMLRCGDSKMLRCGDSTMLRCGDSTMLRCGDSTMLRCGDSTMLRCGDSTMLRCGDSTMLRCGDSTMLRCGDSTMLRWGIPYATCSPTNTIYHVMCTLTSIPTHHAVRIHVILYAHTSLRISNVSVGLPLPTDRAYDGYDLGPLLFPSRLVTGATTVGVSIGEKGGVNAGVDDGGTYVTDYGKGNRGGSFNGYFRESEGPRDHFYYHTTKGAPAMRDNSTAGLMAIRRGQYKMHLFTQVLIVPIDGPSTRCISSHRY
jgi:hypothetical protein